MILSFFFNINVKHRDNRDYEKKVILLCLRICICYRADIVKTVLNSNLKIFKYLKKVVFIAKVIVTCLLSSLHSTQFGLAVFFSVLLLCLLLVLFFFLYYFQFFLISIVHEQLAKNETMTIT